MWDTYRTYYTYYLHKCNWRHYTCKNVVEYHTWLESSFVSRFLNFLGSVDGFSLSYSTFNSPAVLRTASIMLFLARSFASVINRNERGMTKELFLCLFSFSAFCFYVIFAINVGSSILFLFLLPLFVYFYYHSYYWCSQMSIMYVCCVLVLLLLPLMIVMVDATAIVYWTKQTHRESRALAFLPLFLRFSSKREGNFSGETF